MHIQSLDLYQFRNFRQLQVILSDHVNAFTGANGCGKTNLLDAVHYLSMCKSYFNPADSQNISYGENSFIINGTFILNDEEERISCSVRLNQRKIFKRNKKDYDRLSDHIGIFPTVMIAPADHVLVEGGSEERRRLLDMVISQYDHNYLRAGINYNRTLAQRNALLKQFQQTGRKDKSLLQIWDEQLISSGKIIYESRAAFMTEYIPLFNYYYALISDSAEQVEMVYESQLETHDFEQLLDLAFEKDCASTYTSTGIHKDDLLFRISGHPVKRFGSQGQQKTFLIAVKLAQFEYIMKKNNVKPILLLDDIFDKLDDHRVARLLGLVSADKFGQILLTDTSADRVKEIFRKINTPVKIFEVDKIPESTAASTPEF